MPTPTAVHSWLRWRWGAKPTSVATKAASTLPDREPRKDHLRQRPVRHEKPWAKRRVTARAWSERAWVLVLAPVLAPKVEARSG